MFSLSLSPPNVLIYGPLGSGKTSLVNGILKEIKTKKNNLRLLVINGSEEEKNTKTKDKISNFVDTSSPVAWNSKAIVIEEIDSFSMNNQMNLREILEKNYRESQFYITCSFLSRINLAVFSRCALVRLKHPPAILLFVRMKEISEKEKINLRFEDFKKFLNSGIGKIKNTLEFLSTFPLGLKIQKNSKIYFKNFRTINFFRFFQEIIQRDFHFVAFKKTKKMRKNTHFSSLRETQKLQEKKMINISFF